MTRRLFWEDPYRSEFEATVTRVEGSRVVLDWTCFYPRGGGQVGDTGSIDGSRVLDTVRDDALGITHILEHEAGFKVGDRVRCRVDWERRYRIMRLHSAAHIVYYLMLKEYGEGCKPYSSGIVDEEKDRSDYTFPSGFDRERLRAVEDEANRFIQEGHEIRTWTDEEGVRHWLAEGLPEMRCGGTHVRNTREIGRITVRRGKKPGAGKERVKVTLSST